MRREVCQLWGAGGTFPTRAKSSVSKNSASTGARRIRRGAAPNFQPAQRCELGVGRTSGAIFRCPSPCIVCAPEQASSRRWVLVSPTPQLELGLICSRHPVIRVALTNTQHPTEITAGRLFRSPRHFYFSTSLICPAIPRDMKMACLESLIVLFLPELVQYANDCLKKICFRLVAFRRLVASPQYPAGSLFKAVCDSHVEYRGRLINRRQET